MNRPRLLNFTQPDSRNRRPVASVRSGQGEWYRIVKNSFGGGSDVFIFDEIGCWGVSAGDFVADLRALGVQPINVHINSGGGDVWDGMAIYNAIQQHPATVTCYVDGLAASAASYIACAGDRLVMAKNSTMMIHDALTIMIGNASELRSEADLLDKVSDQIAGIYSDRSNRPVDEMRTLMLAETWFNAQEALAAGLIDEIAQPQKQTPQPANGFDLSIFRYAGRDHAPAPQLPATEPEVTPEPPAPASWFDAEGIRSALREAVA